MTQTQSIGIIGGSFDPIHYGHLRLGLEMQQILNFSTIYYVPCKTPVHKENGTVASSKQRLAMIQLAITDEPGFMVDDREITRDSASYMIDTLQSFRQQQPNQAISLILGSDAFLQLPNWKRWRELLDYAHIVVATRPGFPLSLNTELLSFFEQHKLDDYAGLQDNTAGKIYVQEVTSLDISATNIRAQLMAGFNPRYLLPDEVLAYIHQQGIY